MLRYIFLFYFLPAIFQLVLIVVCEPVFFDFHLLPATLVTQFIPWLLVFVIARTMASIFIENDWLSTLTGFLAAGCFVYMQIKTMRWPGKEIMVVSAIAGILIALIVRSRYKRSTEKEHMK